MHKLRLCFDIHLFLTFIHFLVPKVQGIAVPSTMLSEGLTNNGSIRVTASPSPPKKCIIRSNRNNHCIHKINSFFSSFLSIFKSATFFPSRNRCTVDIFLCIRAKNGLCGIVYSSNLHLLTTVTAVYNFHPVTSFLSIERWSLENSLLLIKMIKFSE